MANKVKIVKTGVQAVGKDIDKFLGKIAKDMEKHAKRVVPVDTGKLQDSITSVEGDEDYQYFIGSGVDYALFVEEGTVNQEAQPYLKPAADKLKELAYKHGDRT